MPTYLGVVHANCSERKVGYRGTDCWALGTSATLQNIRLGKYQSPSSYMVLVWSQEHICMEVKLHRGGGNEEGSDSD